MIVVFIGSSPGESIIILFSDGTIVTIDCCKKDGVNYTIECLERLKLNLDRVAYNVITHFHNDHIYGVHELIEKCANSKVVIPNLWRHKEFRNFAASFSSEVTSGPQVIVQELYKVFDLLRVQPRRVQYAQELTCLYPLPAATGASGERLTVLTPTSARQTSFLVRIAEALERDPVEARRIGINDMNDTSLSFILQDNKGHHFLGGDVPNVRPDFDIDHVHRNYMAGVQAYGAVKLPHHGSSTSFSDELRARIDDAATHVFITPYTQGRKKLPSSDTVRFLKGCKNIQVLQGQIIALSRPDRMLRVALIPVRQFRPGIIEFYDGQITANQCASLDDYIATTA